MSAYYWTVVLPDWKVLLAFFVMALAALGAPALGYQITRPHWFIRPLYFLVGVVGIDLLIYYFSASDVEELARAPNESMLRILLLTRVVFFGVAMLMFVTAIQSLKRGDACPLATSKEEAAEPEQTNQDVNTSGTDAASPAG